jgi:hypothetical protein
MNLKKMSSKIEEEERREGKKERGSGGREGG